MLKDKLNEIINVWPKWLWIGHICLIFLGLYVIFFV